LDIFISSASRGLIPKDPLALSFLIIVLSVLILILFVIFLNTIHRLKVRHKENENMFSLYKTFINAEDNLIYLKDDKLKYVFVNKAFEYFFDLATHELTGHDDYELMTHEYAEKMRETDLAVLETESVVCKDIQYKKRIYRTTKFPVTLANGQTGVGAQIKDVTQEQKSIKQHEIHLRTLISIGDGVMVVDQNGMVEMLNKAAEKLTGWLSSEAVGKPYREVFPLYRDGGTVVSDYVADVLESGTDSEMKGNAILLSKCGNRHYIEDSTALIRDDMNKAIGVVVIFRDISAIKEQRDQIEYLSFHDSLTGLYNRRFFEQELRRMDTEDNLPLSIVMGDVNGLKLTNDIFGHMYGDQLLVSVAEVLKRVCKKEDIIARWGGDEFVILMPKTSPEDAKDVMSRIKKECADIQTRAFKGSISMGSATKQTVNQKIMQMQEHAEDTMYFVKSLEQDNIKNSAIDSITSLLHQNSRREREHSQRVSELCQKLGKALNLPGEEIRKLKEAGYLHDIGKVVLEPELMNKNHLLTNPEWNEVKRHSIVGYRILNSFDNTLDLAETVLAHHERWNGSGYPKGLKGEEIPKLARIIAIVEGYDRMTHDSDNIRAMSKEDAIQTLKDNAGILFDPKLVDVFTEMVQEGTT